MKTVTTAILASALSLLLIPPSFSAQRGIRPRKGGKLVWVAPLEISEEVTVPGFWRPVSRRGYTWVEASRDEKGRWHHGYWEPLFKDALDGPTTIPGYWGPNTRTGSTWLKVSQPTTLRWGDSFWTPLNSRRINIGNMEWVPGYWSGKEWIPGYWRPPRKEGYIWSGGYYNDDGSWQEARWAPAPPSQTD